MSMATTVLKAEQYSVVNIIVKFCIDIVKYIVYV